MMYLAIFIWVACGLLQLASGQTACDSAIAALGADSVCGPPLQSGTGVSVLCSARCQALLSAIVGACSAQDAAVIQSAFNAACGACGTATRALQADAACTAAISSPTTVTTICSGTCNVLLNNFVSSCRSQEGVDVTTVQTLLNMLCGGGNVSSACQAATNAVFSNSVCTTAINNDDSATLCSRCRGLFVSLLTACPSNPFGITQADINQECGTGGTGTIKGLGLIGLLLMTTIVSWVY